MGFVDLTALPTDHVLNYKGSNEITPGYYAIVQYAEWIEDDAEKSMSELFIPIEKQVAGITLDQVSHLDFYLANVDTFVEEIAVIPDIEANPTSYFVLKPRETWVKDFTNWLEEPHIMDEWDETPPNSEGEQEDYDARSKESDESSTDREIDTEEAS